VNSPAKSRSRISFMCTDRIGLPISRFLSHTR
jgi:hypothetical protein